MSQESPDWLAGESEQYKNWVEAGSPEPTAAEPCEGDKTCEYPECENPAEWFVEVEGGDHTFYCCHDCGQTNRIYPQDLA